MNVAATLCLLASLAPLQERPVPGQEETKQDEPKGVLHHAEGAYAGYTLFAPVRSNVTYLIDMDGNIVQRWKHDYPPGNSCYLLENGNLLRTYRPSDNPLFRGGGEGGGITEQSWDGELLWDFQWNTEESMSHHDIEPLPGGNVLLIAWEKKTRREALAAGRDPDSLKDDTFWPDAIFEIKPVLPDGGEVVWEWHVWDHLIQDHDPDKPGYGDPAENPGKVDVNADLQEDPPSEEELERQREIERRMRALGYAGDDEDEEEQQQGGGRGRPGGGRADWLHTNSISYNAELDQIALSIRTLSEVWIIDHGLSSVEAAGRGGDLLYRWGNPLAHGMGRKADQQLFKQHDARWIQRDGAWNLLVFNNGPGRRGGDRSSADEIALPLNDDGTYLRQPGRPFGPSEALWVYGLEDDEFFYASFVSGAERLPNGNTLICAGDDGRFLEVDPAGERVWEYKADVPEQQAGGGRGGPAGGRGGRGGPPGRGLDPQGARGGRRGGGGGPPTSGVLIFRATRLAPDYPAFEGRDLSPISTGK